MLRFQTTLAALALGLSGGLSVVPSDAQTLVTATKSTVSVAGPRSTTDKLATPASAGIEGVDIGGSIGGSE